MSMRITTGMSMNTYRFNLMKSTNTLAGSRDKVLTGRQFNSYAENPAGATHAWRIRRSMVKNNDYLNNTKDTYSRFSMAYSAMDAALNEQGLAGVYANIQARTDSEASARQALGQELKSLAETVVQTMNGAKYGDHFVFSGDDAMNPPFSWDDKLETLYYRGVNVNAGSVAKPGTAAPQGWDTNDYGIPKPPEGATLTADEQEWAAYYKDQTDLKKLEAMSKESAYVDLGMGLKEDENGTLINGTAFNTVLPGITMLGGYGLDANDNPENIVMILKKLGDIYSRCDSEDGHFASEEDKQNADLLMNKLKEKTGEVSSQHVDITTKAQFLQNNETRLKDQADTLQEERYNVEMLDPADAITDFMWNYSCFSAALKIGNQLLGQSLIDYMN